MKSLDNMTKRGKSILESKGHKKNNEFEKDKQKVKKVGVKKNNHKNMYRNMDIDDLIMLSEDDE